MTSLLSYVKRASEDEHMGRVETNTPGSEDEFAFLSVVFAHVAGSAARKRDKMP